MPLTIVEWIWLFLMYSFLGWCMEVCYAAVIEKKFVNRGFLNGPWCPIYGFGMLLVISLLYPLKQNQLLLFLGCVILTSLLEFLTGFLLEFLFHSRWWDYSDKPFQLMGYVCLEFSLYWGIAGTFVIDVVHVFFYHAASVLSAVPGRLLLCLIGMVFVADCVLTVCTILHFTRKLRAMDEFARTLRHLSDELGENIFEYVETLTDTAFDARLIFAENVMETRSEFTERKKAQDRRFKRWVKENREQWRRLVRWKKAHKKEWKELLEKYHVVLEQQRYDTERLIKAFPRLKFTHRNHMLERYRQHLKAKESRKGNREGKNKSDRES